MISALKLVRSDDTLPYNNIALEYVLTSHVPEGECVLFLWQNRRTVVIGRNQNAFQECRVEKLEQEQGYLARRLSGGGAVYHDLGNLNFTFIARKEDYDVTRQTEVILQAVRKLGIHAERTGRNDLTVEGRKFSGNAFYELASGGCCHHGTLMMDVDTEGMSRYLNVPADKLKSKGVASVRSRVANLKDFCPEITRELLEARLAEAFQEVYGVQLQLLDRKALPAGEIRREAEHLASEAWLYGRRIPFTAVLKRRFPWGGVRIELNVNEGIIREAACWSDAMDADFFIKLEELLPGQRYRSGELMRCVQEAGIGTGEAMAADLCRMIAEELA